MTITVRSQIIKDHLKSDLRFYDCELPGKPFYINTEILDPHKCSFSFSRIKIFGRRGEIVDVCYSPTEDRVVTSSPKGCFRIWVKDFTNHWKCKATGSQQGFVLDTHIVDGSPLRQSIGEVLFQQRWLGFGHIRSLRCWIMGSFYVNRVRSSFTS